MKPSRDRYQHGSVPKIPLPQGFAWESIFYTTAPDGKRKLKVQTFDSVKYPTERDGRDAGTLGGKLAATLGIMIDRHMAENFLTLATPHRRQTRAS